MQTNKSKTETNQFPTQVAAENNKLQTLLADFFFGADLDSNLDCLNQMCRAFAGIPVNGNRTPREIANMVTSVISINDLLRKIEHAYYEGSFTDTELNNIICMMDCGFNVMDNKAVDIMVSALCQWIDQEEVSFDIKYMSESLNTFKHISDLLKTCDRINNDFIHRLEGGVKC